MSEMFSAMKEMVAIINNEIEAIKKLQEETLAELREIAETDSRRDSIEFGTPGKQGTLKVYFNAADLNDARHRIDNAIELRMYASTMSLVPPDPKKN